MNIDFNKGDGLVPVVIQDNCSLQVLMLGYMNEEAYSKTVAECKVTFYSRSKNRLWTKGESSGHFLIVNDILIDCDNDTVLIKATPAGPTCHRGTTSCFDDTASGFIYTLEKTISDRIDNNIEGSYTNKLYQKGINNIAQKVGEEAVELIIEAKDDNDELFQNEAADLLYHYIVLLKAKGFSLLDIEGVLQNRSEK